MIHKWKQWETDFRVERQVTESKEDYWSSACVFVPLAVLREAMAPWLKMRDGVDLSYCAPAGWQRFCRMPTCSQTAFYPCAPGKPMWCHRHWEESKGTVALRLTTTEAVRAPKPISRVTTTPVGLKLVAGGQEKLF